MSDQTKMTSRIPVTPELHSFLRDFAAGLGTTYDEALKYVFRDVWSSKGDPIIAGREQRMDFIRWQLQQLIDAENDQN